MTYVRALRTLGRDDVAVAGGKGANLGELVREGFPVPPGFIVTTTPYVEFVQANDVQFGAGRCRRTIAE